jgi:hypothetical protein
MLIFLAGKPTFFVKGFQNLLNLSVTFEFCLSNQLHEFLSRTVLLKSDVCYD